MRTDVRPPEAVEVERVNQPGSERPDPDPPSNSEEGGAHGPETREPDRVSEAPERDAAGDQLRHALALRAERLLASQLKNALRLALTRLLEPVLLRLVDWVSREAIQRAFEAGPGGSVPEALEGELQDLVSAIVGEVLADAFDAETGAELAVRSQAVLEALIHKDAASARSEAAASGSILADLVQRVLKRHRKDLVGIATRVLKDVTVDAVTDAVDEGAHAIATKPADAVRGHQESRQEEAVMKKTREKTDTEGRDERRPKKARHALRDELSDAGETLKQQLTSEAEKLQDRLKQGMSSAVKEGTSNQKLGRAPSGRHPSAGSPSRRGPSQKAPGVRRFR